jgi:hypothetical protein
MARIYYDQCEISINNTGILAVSANINTEIALGPVYTLGKRKPFRQQVTTGPSNSTFQIQYLINPTGDPAFNTVSEIKNFISAPTNYNGITIALAGITGYSCYLNNYAVKIEPNNVITAQATYITYNQLSGNIDTKINPNSASASSIAHSSRTNLISGKTIGTNDTYNFSYTFAANLNPIYTLGKREPVEVKPVRAQETVVMTENIFNKLVYTGENVPMKINLSGLLDTGSFTIEMPDAFINNSTLESSLDDIVKTTKTINQYY